jgi:hypothetical protein
LLQEALISQSVKNVSGGSRIHIQKFANASISQQLSARSMDQHDPIGTLQRPTPFKLSYPCALGWSDCTPDRQFDGDFMSVVAETWWVEHLLRHRVLHDINAAACIFSETEHPENADHSEVACSICFPDVLDRHRFWESPRRPNTDERRAKFHANGRPARLVAPVRQSICDRLAKDHLG